MDPEDKPEDTLPALRAEIDQMLMMAPELARTYRCWVDAFKAEGFSESQALYLAASHMNGNAGKAP